MNEVHYLPPGTRLDDISRPEPKPVTKAERTVHVLTDVTHKQEFETPSDEDAIETAKEAVRIASYSHESELATHIVDAWVSSVREDVHE